jgi:acetyl-CoA acetyltransferase
VDWAALDDALMGCANQAGEDNRNVARMATLLAGLPVDVPGATINRLCGSGLDAVGSAARAIRAGDAGLILAGGVESMSRAWIPCLKRLKTLRINTR